MGILITKSEAEGSAVAQVTRTVWTNGAQGGGTTIYGNGFTVPGSGATSPANKIFMLLDSAAAQSANHCNMKVHLKGPGNIKFKGHIDGNTTDGTLYDSAVANELGSDLLPEAIYVSGGIFEQELVVIPFGDLSVNGTYKLEINVRGTMPDLVLYFRDDDGTVVQFMFRGYTHGEAELTFVKS